MRIESNRKYSSKSNSTHKNNENFMTLQIKWPNAAHYSAQISFCGHRTEEHKKKLTALTEWSLYTDYIQRKKNKIALYNGLLNFFQVGL
jgi:hypothetical protein